MVSHRSATARRPRICAGILIVVVCLTLLTHLGTVDATLSINAKDAQLEVNVGKAVSLIWTYNTGGKPYDVILWGKGDSQGINFDEIYFTKTLSPPAPVRQDLPVDLISRVKIKNGASLMISDAKLSDEGYYICEIRTIFVTVKEKIYLKVYDKKRTQNRRRNRHCTFHSSLKSFSNVTETIVTFLREPQFESKRITIIALGMAPS